MSATAPPRVEWIERQLLAGDDLRLAHRYLDVLRARHMRGAHGTWGVALGLELGLVRTGDVEVGWGLAYDAAGRELLVSRVRAVPVPTALLDAGARVVVALRGAGQACVPQADVLVAPVEQPLRPGLDVPLGTIDLGTREIDVESRPHVRSLAPPRVAGGTIPLGGIAITGSALSFTAAVDTSSAGFIGTPSYVVQPLADAGFPPSGALGPLLAVRDPAKDGFTLESRLVFPTAAGASQAAAALGLLHALPFGLTWIGVESPPSCAAVEAADPDCPCLL